MHTHKKHIPQSFTMVTENMLILVAVLEMKI